MKKLLTSVLCLMFAVAFMAIGQAYAYVLPSICYPPDRVLEIEKVGSKAIVNLDKDNVAKLIPVLVKRHSLEPWTADFALVFLREQGVEIVYFVNGCATLQTDLMPSSWKEDSKEAFGTDS